MFSRFRMTECRVLKKKERKISNVNDGFTIKDTTFRICHIMNRSFNQSLKNETLFLIKMFFVAVLKKGSK